MISRFCLLVIGGTGLLASDSTAQEVGGFATVGWSNIDELGDPRGAGFSLSWFPVDRLGARFEYTRTESSARWASGTCDSYWPAYEGCVEETVENESRHDVFDWALVLVPVRVQSWRLETTVGISRVDQEYEIRGVETGRLLHASYLGYGQDLGFRDLSGLFGADRNAMSWGLGVTRVGIGRLPLVLGMGWKRRSVDSFNCLADDSYCPSWHSGFRTNEVRLNVAWGF